MRALNAVWLCFAAMILMASAASAQDITVYSGGALAVGQTKQLTAYVPLSPNTVVWSVNGVTGGNTTTGTVSATGLYQAPAMIPTANAVSVQAASTAYPAKSGAITITITQVPVQLWSISPTSVPPGIYTIQINGAALTPASVIYAGDTPLTTTYLSPTGAKATGTATQAGTIAITVRNPGLGGTTSGAVNLKIVAGSSGTNPTPTPTPTPTPPPTPAPTPIGIALSPTLVSLAPSATQQFTATVTGAANTAVTYTVSGIVGGNATLGTITATGLYTAPAATPNPASVSIRATTVATPATSAAATVNVVGPPNAGTGLGTPNLTAARFLDQATFGPIAADIAHVTQIGIPAWLNEQFSMAATTITDPGGMNSSAVQQQYLSRLTTAPDQLRQRVAYALGQIIVISMNKNIYPDEIVPYLQILSTDAFANYRTLLGDITVSSQMGMYLDLANSTKPSASSGANENYAREMLQLFSIGVTMLNPDGSAQLDAQNVPIPTYDQTAIHQVALALTGWTYPGPAANNFENFTGPMQPEDINHDMTQKTFLGCVLPAGQTTVQDMNATLDCAFNHPNAGPFIATRLIRALVTSNPSGAYIQRVAGIFNNNGAGVRGDLKAVVTAILTDSEARNDTAITTAGRLRDPISHVAAFMRALGGSIAATNGLPWQFSQMSETPLTAPSVFNFFSPMYRIPKSTLVGPEFQIYTPTEAVFRGNMFWEILSNPGSDFTVDLSPFVAAAGDTVALIDKVDQTLLYGRMPQAMRQSLANAITSQSGNTSRAQAAIYLTALSGLYAIQY